jgi:hypothetical protein
VPDDAAPRPAFIGVSRSPWQRSPAFWATLGWHAGVKVRVLGVSDVLRARQGIPVLVLLDEHRQPTEPELLVSCIPDASLPIDVHVGADHPNEQTSGTVFAHFAALASPSVILLRKGLPQPFPIMVRTLSSIPKTRFARRREAGRLSRTDRLLAGGRRRWRWTGLPNRNIAWHNQPTANAAIIEVGS